MTIIKKIKYALAASLIFIIIYIFVAAVPLENDFYFQPEWTKTISGAETISPDPEEAPPAEDSGWEAFMLGDEFGFFSEDGNIVRMDAGGNKFSAGNGAWCVYPQDARETPVYYPNGALKMTISEPGFTHIAKNSVYLFHPGGGAVSMYNDDGEKVWTRDEASPITAFSESKTAAIIGYGNGLLTAVDETGKEIFSFYPGGSDLPVILAAAVSDDGKYAACVSGIDPQRFILIEINGQQHKIIFHHSFTKSMRRQTFAAFGESGKRVFFETDSGLGILDIQKMKLSMVPFDGRILNAGEYPDTNFFVILVKTESGHILSTVEEPEHKIASTEFNAENAFLILKNGGIYLGSDDNISRINIKGLR